MIGLFKQKKKLIKELQLKEVQIQKLSRQLEMLTGFKDRFINCEEKYKTLSNQLPLGVYRTTQSGKILFANQALSTILGYKNVAELYSINASELFAFPSEREIQITNWENSNKTLSDELQFRKRTGEIIWIRDTGKVIFDKYGRVEYFDGIIEDISEYKLTQIGLEESKRKYKTLTNQLSVGIYRTGIDGKIYYVNDSLVKMLGYNSSEELYLKNVKEFHKKKELRDDLMLDRLDKQGNTTNEIQLLKKDKSELWVRDSGKVVFKDNGDVDYFEGVIEDISEYKNMEKELNYEKKLIETLIENIPFPVYIKDKNLQFLLLNKATCRELGEKFKNDVLGKTDFDFFNKEAAQEFHNLEKLVIDQGKTYIDIEQSRLDNDNKRKWSLVTKIPMYNENQEIIGLVGINRDNTLNKETLNALKRSEEKYKQLAELLPEIVFEVDHTFKLKFVNRAGMLKFRYSKKDINKGINIFDLFVDEDKTKIIESLKRNFSGNHLTGNTYKVKRKDNKIFYVKIYNTPIIDQEKIIGLRGIAVDVSEQIKFQENILLAKEKAEMADNLKSAFLANMSHEIRTPLNSIVGFSQLMWKKEISDDKRKKYSNIIHANGQALLKLIDDIIDISKIDSNQLRIEKKEFSVFALMEQVYDTFLFMIKSNRVNSGINILKNIPKVDVRIYSDMDRIRQVILNLMCNAFKFTKEGEVEFGFEQLINGEILFFVSDTGIGIPAEKINMIFDRFSQVDSSCSRDFGGTGLGLAISKGIVEKLGGKIWVTSKLEKGSSFYFTLPV